MTSTDSLSSANNLAREHLDSLRKFYEENSHEPSRAALSYRRILAHYYNLLLSGDAKILEVGCGRGNLLALLKVKNLHGLDLSEKQVQQARINNPTGTFHAGAGEELKAGEPYDSIILSETLNQSADVQQLLEQLHGVSSPKTRLLMNFHSSLWKPVFGLARAFGVLESLPVSNWLATTDVINLLQLADWEVVRVDARILCPIEIPLLATIANRWLAPLLPWLCLSVFIVARPRPSKIREAKVSVVVPARNEAGNIEAAVTRTAEMGLGTEIIFVEGNSRDNTWEEIQRVAVKYQGQRNIKILQQKGIGKGDAVRAGFAEATGEILMILDADLTMPPEELPKFYQALAHGRAEFANGVRLVYPMEKEAMRFLNLCANKFFSLAFSWLLGQPVKDTLCGTKVLWKSNYLNIIENRTYFGDFDPFGDFDLLFGADKLNLKIMDIPIRYRDRTYGTTNIHRWRHGLLLLRMVAFAARKLKFI